MKNFKYMELTIYKYITIAIKTPVRFFSRSRYKFFKISFEKVYRSLWMKNKNRMADLPHHIMKYIVKQK